MPGLLEGDRALVTGAGRGIGRAMAEAIEQEGAQVFRADLAEADLVERRRRGEARRRGDAQARQRLDLRALRQPATTGNAKPRCK